VKIGSIHALVVQVCAVSHQVLSQRTTLGRNYGFHRIPGSENLVSSRPTPFSW